MPAAAVIPAPVAYVKVVAVKTFVVLTELSTLSSTRLGDQIVVLNVNNLASNTWQGLMSFGGGWSCGYSKVRGEILRPFEDQLMRKRAAHTFSTIKDES